MYSPVIPDVKKAISIVFIFLLLFNVLGYYGLFFGLHYQNRQQLIQRFDAGQYNQEQAITIKVPLAIPYASDTKEYQRVDGDFEHNSVVYRMVKQRLSQDTLYIVCVKDTQGTRINQALTDYVKTFTDNPAGSQHHALTLPAFIKEYIVSSYTMKSQTLGWSSDVCNETSPVVLIDSFCASIVHPPERA